MKYLWLGCLCFIVLAAQAQYSLDWHKIAGGGGTSAGGGYQLTGTIGQSDAGSTMTNGQFALTGGFWALPQAEQTASAPTLTIAPASPGFATISWAPTTAGYVLQESGSLSPGNWTNSLSGSTNPVTVRTDTGARYFRLTASVGP